MYAGMPGMDEMSLLCWSSGSELFKYTLVTLGHFKNEYIFSPEKELGEMELDVPMAAVVLQHLMLFVCCGLIQPTV